MRHTAKLIFLGKVREVSEEIIPFVRFKAEMDGRVASSETEIAILQIEGTSSYHPIFLPERMDEIEKQLGEINVVLSGDAKRLIKRFNAENRDLHR
jgi:hypothetical protein